MGRETQLFQSKGIRDGIHITFGNYPWTDLRRALIEQIKTQPSFYKGARLSLDVGIIELRIAELSSLRDTLSDFGMNLWAVLSESPLTLSSAQNLGFATKIPSTVINNQKKSIDNSVDMAKWIQGPLRSGVKIFHNGNVVIEGDVNPGAEVIASGNIMIWGRLRGIAHAGAEGNESMQVFALEMAPTQLRIGEKIAISPRKMKKSGPEVASLINGEIIAQSWEQDRKNS